MSSPSSSTKATNCDDDDTKKKSKFISRTLMKKVCAAPKINEDLVVEIKEKHNASKLVDLSKDVAFEKFPLYKDLQIAELRESQRLKDEGKVIKTNTLSGFIENANFNDVQFEEQRRLTNQATKLTIDTDDPTPIPSEQTVKSKKRIRNDDPTDVDGYLGPWAGYDSDKKISKPSEEDAVILRQYMEKRRKKYVPSQEDEHTGAEGSSDKTIKGDETAQLHIKDPYDYQGRSFLIAPRDIDGVNLYSDSVPEFCRIPDRLAHTYTGHTKAITATRYFPNTAHLILSSSLDKKVKLWEVYKQRRCIMTYSGHLQGVRDIDFNPTGDKFLSSSYDNMVRLWDTETGQCVNRFTTGKMAFCVKFNPEPELSHFFLAGMSNKKVVCWDTRTGELVQEYDRHMGPVNTITYVDENRKFVSTSDDKTIRVWEWDIPVDVKYIADPTLHSMPAVTSSRNNKRLLCQSMDNKIHVFTCNNDRFKLDSKKIFRGHMVAGYACVPDFSSDLSMVVSGDAEGRIFFWAWGSGKILRSFKAHSNACISVMWHPHEKQRLISAGWDNVIKLWE